MAGDIAWKSIKDLEALAHGDAIRIAVMNTRVKLADELAKLPIKKLEDIWNTVRNHHAYKENTKAQETDAG